MARYLACLALALAFAAAPVAFVTPASLAKSAKVATKVCKHKTASGKIKTWRCRKDQPCCVAEMINYYTCGSKLLGCL